MGGSGQLSRGERNKQNNTTLGIRGSLTRDFIHLLLWIKYLLCVRPLCLVTGVSIGIQGWDGGGSKRQLVRLSATVNSSFTPY